MDDYTQNEDAVNFQLVILSPEEYPENIDLNQVIDDVNYELAEEDQCMYLRLVEDTQNDEILGYLTNNDGEILPLSTSDDIDSMPKTITTSEVQTVINDKINDAVQDQLTDSSQLSTATSVSAWYINVSLSTSYDADKNRVKATASKVGAVPSPANLTLKLQNRLTGGSFSTVQQKTINFRTTKSGSVKYGTTKTRIWRATLTGKIGASDISYKTYSYVYNEKCKRYPSYTEVYSKKKLYTPPTNLAINQNARSSTFRKNYIDDFKNKYPNANINWDNYEIHHMRPLKFGGTNSVSNGFAATISQHKTLTSWWASY